MENTHRRLVWSTKNPPSRNIAISSATKMKPSRLPVI